jgi:hypothetical protein
MPTEKQLTTAPHGHILTNIAVWSPDSSRIVYDTRSDPAGDLFDGRRIGTVDALTGEVRTLYESENGACCGVATFHPHRNQVVFIHGPESPTPDWSYGPTHRQGVLVDEANPMIAVPLDARDLTPPFTPGALRGGSHVHVFSGDGEWVSFTYEDHMLARFTEESADQEINLRNVGVCVPRPVHGGGDHPRNHDGTYFSALVTRTTANPVPGSDEIKKAFEDAWIGVDGYRRADGTHQKKALAFQGHIVDSRGQTHAEVFVVDLPEDVTRAGDGPLEGTATLRPRPPLGTSQRRLTFTDDRKFPGLQGPRHWARSTPDGLRIAFLMRDDDGIVQLWTVSPSGGPPAKLTRNAWPIASAFSWSPDGLSIAHAMDNSVCLTDAGTGQTRRLTERSSDAQAPRPEACVWSPNGERIAFVRRIEATGGAFNQIFVCAV